MTTPYPPKAAADEIAALPAIIALGVPVRIDDPMGKSATYRGDARGPGAYIPFVVVALYDGTPKRAVPVRLTKLIVRCHGASRGAAWALWSAVEPAFRDRGARMSADRLGVWHSGIVSVTPDKDPLTDQPVVYAIVNYPTTLGAM
jgi:hypothetical protein